MDNEPKALAVTLLSNIISDIKQSQPTRSDGKSTSGYVYSQLRVGQMIQPSDFAFPWSPMGGAAAARAANPGPLPGGATTQPPDKNAATDIVKRAMEAAETTKQFFNTMLVVTNDGTLETYGGGGRHVDVAYKGILDAMEAPPPPARPADEQAKIDAARAVLWNPDHSYTDEYNSYLTRRDAWAQARADYTTTENRLLADPAQADSAPILLAPAKAKLDRAWEAFKTDATDKVENALATVEALGVPVEQGMIADARQLFAEWSVDTSGVGAASPYTYILPSGWPLVDLDNIGWTQLTIGSSDYHSHVDEHGENLSTGNWSSNQESNSGEAGLSVFGFGFSGGYSASDWGQSSQFSNQGQEGMSFHNDASSLSISLEYGLCTIMRPWFISDLFFMRNWYLRGEKKGAISTGTIDSQVGNHDLLLPMIPTHFLIVRNVSISAEQWNSDGQTLDQWHAFTANQAHGSASQISGGVSIPVFGPISVGGSYAHSESESGGSFTDESGHTHSNDYGSHWDGTTLSIRGAQIVAWLSEVIRESPPMDDPALGGG